MLDLTNDRLELPVYSCSFLLNLIYLSNEYRNEAYLFLPFHSLGFFVNDLVLDLLFEFLVLFGYKVLDFIILWYHSNSIESHQASIANGAFTVIILY